MLLLRDFRRESVEYVRSYEVENKEKMSKAWRVGSMSGYMHMSVFRANMFLLVITALKSRTVCRQLQG